MADELELELDYGEYNEDEGEEKSLEAQEITPPRQRAITSTSDEEEEEDYGDREYRRGETPQHVLDEMREAHRGERRPTRNHGSFEPSRRGQYQHGMNRNQEYRCRSHDQNLPRHRPPPPPPPQGFKQPPPPSGPPDHPGSPPYHASMYNPPGMMMNMMDQRNMMDTWFGTAHRGGRGARGRGRGRGRESYSYKRERDSVHQQDENGISEEEAKKRKLEAIRAKREEQAAKNRQLAEERKATIEKLNAAHEAKMEAKRKHLESLQEKRDRLRMVVAEKKKAALLQETSKK